jgi:hypothetical protein
MTFPDGLTDDEKREVVRLLSKKVPFTDKEHIAWAREAVRRDIKTALADIESPKEKEQLFEVLRHLLDKMEARRNEPVRDGLKRIPRL